MRKTLPGWRWFKSHFLPATKHDLKQTEQNIMSAISNFAASQNALFAQIDTAISGIQSDIQVLNDKITALQNSAGTISPEDQALLDELQAHAQAMTERLAALDALTPDAPPAEPAAPPV